MRARASHTLGQVFLPRSALRTKLYLVYTLPLLVVVITLLFASQRRISSLQERQIAIADSLIHALTQSLRRIELFDDQVLWADLSTLLSSFPEIEYLVAYDAQGGRQFYYHRDGLPILRTPPPTQEGATISGNHLHLLRLLPVERGATAQSVHHVYLRQDGSALRLQARIDQRRILLLGLGLMGFALLGSVVAHRVLILPIEALAERVCHIADTRDYRLRSGLDRSDELGALARGFDHLLDRVCEELGRRNESAHEREKLIRELEQRNAELDRFAHSVSHDLRNPLVTIHLFADRLLNDLTVGKTGRAVPDLGRIVQATERMGRLLEDLLALSQVGRTIQSPEPVDLGSLFEELLDNFLAVREATNTEVTLGKNLPWVLADRSRMLAVFQNLLENALKFSDGPPRIEVGARREGNSVLCHVRDHGIGIDPRYHRRIFDLFERLTPEREGTGIGLALVQSIIEAHGGRVWVESAGPGLGSTFLITLPRAEMQEPTFQEPPFSS